MTQSKESTGKTRFLRCVRVAVMFLSFGFIFPHVMTEDMDIDKHDANKDAKVKRQ